MWKLRCLSLLSVFATLLLIVPSGRAQDWADSSFQRPSHIVIDGDSPADAENLLRNRLNLAKKNTELEKLAADVIRDPEKYGLTEPELRKLAERYAEPGKPPLRDLDPDSPEVKKAVEEAQQAVRNRSLRAADPRREEKRLGDELRNIANRPSDPRFQPEPVVQKPTNAKPEMIPNPPPSNPTGPQGSGAQSSMMSRPAQSPASAKSVNNSRWLRSFSDALGNSPLTDSDTLRSFAAALAENQRAGSAAREDRKFGDNPLEKSLGGLGRHLPDKVDLPDMKWSVPRADLRTPPTTSASADINGESLGMAAIIIVMAALGVLAAWGLWRFGPPTRWRRTCTTEGLGPWPVSPGAVHTRAELIRAFEYLAVLLLGRAARSLNHLDIAAGLVNREPQRREAADRLAHAYEQARYAPPDEPLPEEELLSARRDLCLLAGAAAV